MPADCTVLVVAGPEKDLLAAVAAALRDYVKGGGKVLVHGGARAQGGTPHLVALLKEWNLEAGAGRGGRRLGHGHAREPAR